MDILRQDEIAALFDRNKIENPETLLDKAKKIREIILSSRMQGNLITGHIKITYNEGHDILRLLYDLIAHFEKIEDNNQEEDSEKNK